MQKAEAAYLIFKAMEFREFNGMLMAILEDKTVLKDIARLTRDDVQKWYRALPEDWFDNPKPYPDGTPRHARPRTFMYPLGTSWEYQTYDFGYSVFFKHGRTGQTSHWGLRLQQYGSDKLPGQRIRPVNKKALTIPVTAEAHGRSTREFEAATGHSLFKVGQEEGHKIGTLVWADEDERLHAAYVLRKSSYVPPLKKRRGHDAIPSPKEFAKWAKKNFTAIINDILENGL